MMLSKGRSAKLLIAAMVSLVAFVSFWPACAHCLPLGSATVMEMSADTGDAPCVHDVLGQSSGDCGGLTEACLDVD